MVALNVGLWLDQLHTALRAVQCRVDGSSADYEAAASIVAERLAAVKQAGGTVWWAGNGGSASLCAHLSQDMLNKLGMRSMTLSDAGLLTCMANDYGYRNIYARPLAVLLRPGDLVIAVSSSGRSENILAVAETAHAAGARLITLSAFADDNPLWHTAADVAFFLPCALYGHAEVGHEALMHAIIESVWLREQKSGCEA
jgi:D-sedoheptulose 7-phosphate isomerase